MLRIHRIGIAVTLATVGFMARANAETYRSERHQVRITPPEGWEPQSLGGKAFVHFFAPSDGPDDPFPQNINIVAIETKSPDSLEVIRVALDLLNAEISKTFENVTSTEPELIDVGGDEGLRHYMTMTHEGRDLKAEQRINITHGRVYTYTFTTLAKDFEAQVEAFETAMKSVVYE